MSRRDRQEYDRANHVGKGICEHKDTLLARPGRKVRSGEQEGHDDRTLGDREQVGLESREPKGLDDQIGERAETAGGQRVGERDQVEAPGLRVLERLHGLVRLELFVLDAGLVFAHAFDHEDAVLGREALGAHGRVGEPPKDEDAPEDRETAEEGEENLPGGDRPAINVVDTVSEQAADALLQTVHGVKAADGDRLFLFGVPHGGTRKGNEPLIGGGGNGTHRSTNPGWQTHSNIPRRVRTITRPVKFLQAAVHARTAPHAVILNKSNGSVQKSNT
jgi:hypothetical protein